ncbi:uncharacterized protein [Mytilus edulis]|uniref:uncharacterized protein n=1 Tax=Mytilus edulis TaxID=6550 RepID=UPI0039EF51A3
MYTLSVLGLSICLVYISIIMQGTEADKCSDCSTAATKAVLDAGGDKDKICSAGRTFIDCMEDNCDVASFKTALDAAKKAHTQLGCGAEADTCSECKKTYEDKGKTCSAANVYVACAEKDCTSFTQIFKVFSARAAQKACGAEAGTCISCIADFGKAAGFDKDKLCSAAKTYVECIEEGCKSGVAVAEKAKEAACGTCDACTTTFAGEVGLDREKYCSAANAYLECAKQDCTMDDIATVALAKAAQQGCGK